MHDRDGEKTTSKGMAIKVLGSVFVAVVVAWAISASLPYLNESTGDTPAPSRTLKQEEPTADLSKGTEPTYETKLVEVQKLLKQWGLYKSNVDGVYGPGTKAALESFQAQNGLEQTGKLDNATFDRLRDKAPSITTDRPSDESGVLCPLMTLSGHKPLRLSLRRCADDR